MKRKAQFLDAQDELKEFKQRFACPTSTYLCSNSLGLPPKDVFPLMQKQLDRWATLGVEGWFHGDENWYNSFDLALKKPLAKLLGAEADEVVFMNSLTVNLHLLLVSFYQPTPKRNKILVDTPIFPSDLYAIKSQMELHGYHPDDCLITLKPRPGESLLHLEDFERAILNAGSELALVLVNPVNFLTGQVLDIPKITSLAHHIGALAGCDTAHAAGNILLHLHEWEVDFAFGCSYKYLCSGPGGPGYAYVHASHHNTELPRLSGWWGNDPATRFRMQLQPDFIPYGGAASWQLSTLPVLALTPLLASLTLFEEAGIARIRKKSCLQTAYLLELLDGIPQGYFQVITPRNPDERGAQLSLVFPQKAEACLEYLQSNGFTCDFRAPNVIRITPSPLYNSFEELYEMVCCLKDWCVEGA